MQLKQPERFSGCQGANGTCRGSWAAGTKQREMEEWRLKDRLDQLHPKDGTALKNHICPTGSSHRGQPHVSDGGHKLATIQAHLQSLGAVRMPMGRSAQGPRVVGEVAGLKKQHRGLCSWASTHPLQFPPQGCQLCVLWDLRSSCHFSLLTGRFKC